VRPPKENLVDNRLLITDYKNKRITTDGVREIEMNQREVAEVLGLSRAMVQKIEERALLKLRMVLIQRGILKEDLIGE
jgi:DNA-directed RNA polymerase specialized sigma subunit